MSARVLPANSAAAHDDYSTFPVQFISRACRKDSSFSGFCSAEESEMVSGRAALLVLLLSAFAAASAVAQLDDKFYSHSCPSVEDVVRKEMVRALSLAPSLAGPLLRMHFHDCFVRVRAV